MSIEQPEEALSSNNLGTEIWETNSSGSRQIKISVKTMVLLLLSSNYKDTTLFIFVIL